MTVKNQIERLIYGKSEEESIPMTPVRDIEKILKDLGYNDLDMDGDETNGWQIDFWYKFTHSTLPGITMSGSLHYGNFKLYLTQIEEEE